MSKFEEIADALTEAIRRGDISPGEPLPAVTSIAAEYQVARDTARHAVRLLEERGLVQQLRGAGHYVTSPDSERLISKAERVANALRAEIESGRFPRDSRVPGELELAERFGVGRVTIRRALERLESLGLVVTRPGVGRFVAAQRGAPTE